VAVKVMLSSVRRGLADVRDSVTPVLRYLGYEVLRFEDVTTLGSAPPRAVCVEMVEAADIYLLLLGEEYGNPMPGTDRAPTEEEWTVARRLGKPTVVFRREGVEPQGRQAAFIAKVEDYESGVWRGTFRDIPDLLSQLGSALSGARNSLRPVGPLELRSPVAVRWLGPSEGGLGWGRPTLETHVMTADSSAARLPAAALADMRRSLLDAGNDHGLFELGQQIDFRVDDTGVVAQAGLNSRGPAAGIRVLRDRTISVWESLPSGQMPGAVLDQGQFSRQVARDLRLAGGLGILEIQTVAIAIGLDNVATIGIPAGPTTMTLPFAGRGRELHVDPSDAWPSAVLAAGADEVARELVARLMLQLDRR